jgi:U4/U6.U5 tri-snRNP-associated protein 2
VQALSHVEPMRKHVLLTHTYATELGKNACMHVLIHLANRFGLLVRKMWSPRAFKCHVSPHELVQEVSNASARKFNASHQADTSDFLLWFLNALHSGFGGGKAAGSSKYAY